MKTQDFTPHGLPQAPFAALEAPSTHGCGQKFPASCFPSWIGAKSSIFFS